MGLDPAIFVEAIERDLHTGDWIQWRRKGEEAWKFGTLTLVWMGLEEMFDVVTVDGKRHTLCIGLGDEVQHAPTS